MKATIRSITALTILAFSTPAIAGGVNVYDDGDSKLKLSAKFFVNTTSTKSTGDGTVANNGVTQTDQIGTALDRAYFSAKYQFDNIWSMGLTTDATLETAAGLGKRTNVFIKKAYLKGKFSDEITVTTGVIATPWIGYNDKLYKHRYVQKSFTDKYKMDSSADAGIGISGKLADGLFQYALAEVNGGGYANISQSKSLDFNSRIGFYPIEGLTLDVQFRDGYMGSKKLNAAGTKHQLIQGMVTYGVGKTFRVGVNYIQEKSDQKDDVVNAVEQHTIKSIGYGVWGWANFNKSFGAFGKLEVLKQKSNLTTGQPKTTRVVGGLEYKARKNIDLSLVADYGITSDGVTSNKVGSWSFASGAKIKTIKVGLYSQIKF